MKFYDKPYKMRKIVIAVLTIAALLTSGRAMAWGGFAHSAITEIAERNLTDKAREQIHHYLNLVAILRDLDGSVPLYRSISPIGQVA